MRTVCLLCLAVAVHAASLSDTLREHIAGFSGTVSLYAKNLDTGKAIGIRETEPVRTASTIKLPIMTAVFDALFERRSQVDGHAHHHSRREGGGHWHHRQ